MSWQAQGTDRQALRKYREYHDEGMKVKKNSQASTHTDECEGWTQAHTHTCERVKQTSQAGSAGPDQ